MAEDPAVLAFAPSMTSDVFVDTSRNNYNQNLKPSQTPTHFSILITLFTL